MATLPTFSLNPVSALSMKVELIVITGLARGTAAPIQIGHYLIGRHAECQIRPESSNVSRRHCLLWNDGEKVGASDLESSWGTFVNEEPLKPHVWKLLKDSDTLRVGDFSFQVRIHAEESQSSPPTDQEPSVEAPPVIRRPNVPAPATSSTDAIEEFDSDEPAESASESASESAEPTEPSAESVDKNDRGTPSDAAEKRRRRAEKYRKPKRSMSLPSINTGDSSWKLIVAALAAVLIFSWFGYSIYRFQVGSPPEIREGID